MPAVDAISLTTITTSPLLSLGWGWRVHSRWRECSWCGYSEASLCRMLVQEISSLPSHAGEIQWIWKLSRHRRNYHLHISKWHEQTNSRNRPPTVTIFCRMGTTGFANNAPPNFPLATIVKNNRRGRGKSWLRGYSRFLSSFSHSLVLSISNTLDCVIVLLAAWRTAGGNVNCFLW